MADAPGMDKPMETEDPNFEQALAYVFGIRSHGSRAYLALFDNPKSTVTELAEVLDYDRSSASRSLTTFLDKDLTERKCRPLNPDGCVYQYMTTPLPGAKEMMHAAFDEWAEDVHAYINASDES